MKTICWLVLATLCFLGVTGPASARLVRFWSYQELLDKSDLAVIATPEATNDTAEQISPGIAGLSYTGIETRFKVAVVLKGDPALKTFALHHYRPPTDAAGMEAPDGPTFVTFPLPKEPGLWPQSYMIFLVRETDGRYAPAVGQTDPGLSIKELAGVYSSPLMKTQTELGVDFGNVLKECQTIKPGMTRAALAPVFCEEGGLSTVTHRTYVYHDCPYVKVDVDFAPSSPKQDTEQPTDVITKISRPYLDWSFND